MPCVETKIVINGDSKPIFEIIKNMEAYPSFMIAGLLNPILKKKVRENSENMLTAVKAQIEK